MREVDAHPDRAPFSQEPPKLQSPAVFFVFKPVPTYALSTHKDRPMTASASSHEAWYPNVEKTSQTDDQRIEDITVLPLPNI